MFGAPDDTKPRVRHLGLVVGVVVVLIVLIWFRHLIDLPALHARAVQLNALVVILCVMLLPLVGVPVSVLHAIAGAKFGLPLGMTLVGCSIAFQLVASYAIVNAAPNFFARKFSWLHDHLPPTTHRSLTLFTMLLPGAPFFAQNYALAIARVPFAIYFGYSFPIHFARSLIGVVFGKWSEHPTPARIAVFVVYAVGVTLTCGLAFRRLRAQLRNQPPEAGDPKPRG